MARSLFRVLLILLITEVAGASGSQPIQAKVDAAGKTEFDQSQAASAIIQRANDLYFAKDRAGAEKLLRESLSKVDPRDRFFKILVTEELARILGRGQPSPKFEPMWRQVLAMREALFGKNHEEYAQGVRHLAEFLVDVGRVGESIGVYRQYLGILERVRDTSSTGFTNALMDVADLIKTAAPDEAKALYDRALVLREKADGRDSPNIVYELHKVASFHSDSGRFADAERLLKRAFDILAKSPPSESYLDPVFELAEFYRARQRWPEAEEQYWKALAVWEAAVGPDDERLAAPLKTVATFLSEAHSHPEAILLQRRRIAIIERTANRIDLIYALSSLADDHRKNSEPNEANLVLNRMIALAKSDVLAPSEESASAIASVARQLEALERWAEAEALRRREVEVREQAQGRDYPSTMDALNALAATLEKQKHPARAEPLYRRVAEIETPTAEERDLEPYRRSPRRVARSALAGILEVRGQLVAAETLRRKAAAENEESLWNQEDRTLLARNLMLQGRDRDATMEFRKVREELATQAVMVSGRGLSRIPEWVLSTRFRYPRPYLTIQPALAERIGDPAGRTAEGAIAFETAQLGIGRSTAGVIAQSVARMASGSGRKAELVRTWQQAVKERREMEGIFGDGLFISSFEKEQRRRSKAALERKLDVTEAALRRELPQFFTLISVAPVPLAEIQPLLAQDEALLLYLIGSPSFLPGTSYLWVVRRDSADFVPLPTDEDALGAAVDRLRLALDPVASGSKVIPPFDYGLAHQLYQQVLAPAERLLDGIRHVVVVPSGALERLPLSVLTPEPPSASRRPAWLMRRYALTTAPSVSAFRNLRLAAPGGAATRPFAGFGDPVLEGRPGDARGKNHVASRGGSVMRGALANVDEVRRLERLEETAQELQGIATSLRADADALNLRERATETRAKQLDLSQYRVLAFATHGLMSTDLRQFGEPALVMTPPRVATEQDDGLLAASEIAQMKLNAEWVILSACNTAAPDGKTETEGLSGLAKAFFHAGARSLLVSHWYVESLASMKLTTAAIAAYAAEPAIGRAEALRRSMVALADDPERSHPAFWAPFVVVGEGGAGR